MGRVSRGLLLLEESVISASARVRRPGRPRHSTMVGGPMRPHPWSSAGAVGSGATFLWTEGNVYDMKDYVATSRYPVS
jgi:hypothetical protein